MIIKEKDIVNIQKSRESDLFNVELNKSSNNYKFFTTPWQNIPRYNKEGKLLSPEEFKRETVDRDGIVKFNQNYACVDGNTIVNVYDSLKVKHLKIKILDLYNNFKKDRFKIQTSNLSYSNFDDIKKTQADTLTLYFEDSSSICISYDHRFVIQSRDRNRTIYARNLKIGDSLQKSDKSLIKIQNIEHNGKTDVYDVLETNNHTYITNDIISHNCEFVGSSYTLLSSDKLSGLVSEDYIELKDGKLRIYEYPKKGHQYIMAVDPAKNGIDAFAVQIVDITEMTFRQVACAQLQIDFMLMPEWLDDWGKYYNMAYIIIENNEGAGTYAASTLFKTYEYYNLFWERSRETGKKKKEAGFRTTQYSRGLILNTLRLFTDNDKIIIRDSSTIQELYTFALVDGKYQAIEGCHDDMVMSLAIVFAPFADARNFDDMRAITKQIYNKGDNFEGDTKNLAHLLNNAVFDDCGDDALGGSPFDDRGEEFLGSVGFGGFGDIRQGLYDSNIEDEMGL